MKILSDGPMPSLFSLEALSWSPGFTYTLGQPAGESANMRKLTIKAPSSAALDVPYLQAGDSQATQSYWFFAVQAK